MPASRRRTVVLASAGVLLVLGALLLLVVVGVTQTAYGRQIVRDLVQEELAGRVQGRLHVGRISGGLLTDVTIDSLEIRGPDDSLFVASGPVTVTYDPRDLLDRRLLLRHVQVERPVVHLVRHADGVWNFRRIFPSGPAQPRAPRRRGFGDFVVIDSATVRGGRFLLTMPWRPADSLRGARRDSAVRYALAREDVEIRERRERRAGSDTSYHARTRRWTGLHWESNGVRLADPDSSGRRFGIARLAVVESDPPFDLRDARGMVRLLGDSLWIDVPHFDLPGSTGRATGQVVWGSGLPVRYDLRIVGDSVALADVAWVYATLPREGGGSVVVDIRNDPEELNVLDYALRDMDLRTTGSRLRGDMTFSVGGPVLAVKDVALRAEPVDFDLLRTLAGGPFSYDWQGTLTGTVRGPGGPLHRFRVDSAAVVFRDANVPGVVTRGSGRGELDILDPAFTRFRGFRVNVAELDLRTLQHLNPDFPRLNGVIAGSAVLDSLWTDVRFRDAALEHRDGAADPSRVTGSGRVTLGDDLLRYDLDVEAAPLSFTTLARSYPAIPVRGSYAGPLRVQGTLDDLALATALTGPAGSLAVDGRFDLFGPDYRAVGTASTAELDLSALLNRLDVPPTALTLASRFDLAGSDAATLAGTFALDLDRSRVDSVRVFPSTARLTFGAGLARVDSLRLSTSAVELTASGGLGLAEARPDSVTFTLRVDSLGGLRRYLLADAEPGAAPDTLEGFVEAHGVLSGSTRDGIALRGTLRGGDLAVGGTRARRLDGAFALADVLRAPNGPVQLMADSARLAGVRLARATLGADVEGFDAARLRLDVESATGPRATATAALHRAPDSTRLVVDSAAIAVGGDTWRLARPAAVRTDRAGLALDTLDLRGPGAGRIVVGGVVPVGDTIALTVRADAVPLRHLGLLAQANSSLDGQAWFSLDLGGVRAAPVMLFGGAVTGARFGEVQLARLTLDGSYAERRLETALALARRDTLLLRAGAVLPVDLALLSRPRRVLDEPLTGNIRSERVDLGVLEGFTTLVRDAAGTFTLNLDLGGTLRRPELHGGLQVAGGSFTLPRAGIALRQVEADIGFDGDSVAVRRVAAASGRQRGSSLLLTGGIGVEDLADPTFDLTLAARDFHAIALPRLADLDVSTTPDLRLTGRLTAATLAGGVRVERGTIYLPEFSSKQVIDLDDPEFANVVDTVAFGDRGLLPGAPPVLLRNLALRGVGIEMGDEVWLRGPEANINLGGRVNLTTAPSRTRPGETSLALDGVLTANRGTYRLNLGVVQRTFVIERGSLRFFGEPELNPTLDIVALHTVRQFDRQVARQDVEVRAIIGGTLAQPQLRLTGGFAGGGGGIALSESDAVSYLVTGAPSFALGADESSELTAARLALASLGSYLGDRAAGGLFDVVQFQTAGLESGDTRNLRSAGAGILAGTRLGVGIQLSDRAFVTANAGLCQLGNFVGGSSFNAQDFAESIGIKVDYRLGGALSLSAGVEPPTAQLFCSRQINPRGFAPTPRQWAFDLFRTWRF